MARAGIQEAAILVLWVSAQAWAIEIKLARPFGDYGARRAMVGESLYPYAGNTSAIGVAFKRLNAGFNERRAIVGFGYEHTQPKIELEPAIRGFKVLARDVVGIQVGARTEELALYLVHPYHPQFRLYGWEVPGLVPLSA